MRIYQITPITYKHQQQQYQTKPLDTLSFEARVDKGMDRFYSTNETRMPQTVIDYVATLDDKTKLTPLETQQNAFELLSIAQNAEDIKSAYPSPAEPLFKDLINPQDSKARRGIIKLYNDFADDLHAENKDILKSKENFTVYLVKKVFLENKTIDEINNDLETDLEPDFKALFRSANAEESKYIHSTTLSSLGIQPPSHEYRQSLRYTKDGYSDFIGGKISEAQRAFWDSMPEEQRTARAKKSVEKFENWWEALTQNEKLDLIATQETEIEMLKKFKAFQRQDSKQHKTQTHTTTSEPPRPKTRVGSTKLSQDELFIKWATNNLKKFNEGMSEADKDSLHIKRMHLLSSRWKEMSAAERTDYISKMKSGSEPLRYAMIDAWNNSMDLIKALSSHLRENQIHKPADILYSSQEFSQFQSQVMSEFWEKHPDFATQLGEKIQHSNEKIKAAISNGTFEELKRQILRDKTQRIKSLEAFKKTSPLQTQLPQKTEDYLEEFKFAYLNEPHANAQLKNMPQAYIDDYFKAIGAGYNREQIEVWTKNLRGEAITNEELQILRQIAQSEPPQAVRMNRAIEAALANVLYDCTNNPEVFRFSHSDCKTAIAQIDRGEQCIHIVSQKEGQEFQIPLVKRRIDKTKIANLYRAYKEELSGDETYRIAHSFFETKTGDTAALEEYISGFGKSANIIFSDRNVFPNAVKERFYQKFANNMPQELKENVHCFFDRYLDPFKRETQIKRINFLLSKRFDFIPSILMQKYQDEVGRALRMTLDPSTLDEFESRACAKRTNIKVKNGLAFLPKLQFQASNTLRLLAGEQVLAEALYDTTRNPEVFAMQFEELCDNIELFNMVKKFPSESRTYYSQSLDKEVTLTATSKLDLKSLKDEYLACTNDVTDLWLNSEVKTHGAGKLSSLIDILSNGESNPKILEAIAKRIKAYKLRLI